MSLKIGIVGLPNVGPTTHKATRDSTLDQIAKIVRGKGRCLSK